MPGRPGLRVDDGDLRPAFGDALVAQPAPVVLHAHPPGVAPADQREQVLQAAGGDHPQFVAVQQADRHRGRRLRPGADPVGGGGERGDLGTEDPPVPPVHRGLVLGVPRHPGQPVHQRPLDLGVASRVQAMRVEVRQVDVAGPARLRPAVQPVPDQVAEHAPTDQPVGRVHVADRPQRGHQPVARPDQRLQPHAEVEAGPLDGIRIQRIGWTHDSAILSNVCSPGREGRQCRSEPRSTAASARIDQTAGESPTRNIIAVALPGSWAGMSWASTKTTTSARPDGLGSGATTTSGCAPISAGKFEAVLVTELSLLHRRPLEWRQFRELGKARRLKIKSLSDFIDLETGEGALGADLRVDEEEVEQIRTGVGRKSLSEAKEGRPHSGGIRPFGYKYDNGTLIIIPEEAALVREAASRVRQDESLAGICADWQQRGITTPKGNMWVPTTLRQTLLRRSLAGYREHPAVGAVRANWAPI